MNEATGWKEVEKCYTYNELVMEVFPFSLKLAKP